MVVAILALVFAVAGTSFAVSALPRNSVGTPQLKNKAVTGAKVKANALTGAQIKESTLAEVPAGGIAGLTYKVATVIVPAGMGGPITVTCDSGEVAIAGGAETPHGPEFFLADTHPAGAGGPGGLPNQWESTVANLSSAPATNMVYAVCAKAGPGGTVTTAKAATAGMALQPFGR